ncbi:MAG: hypothetical protein ABL901_00860 [Hyphomicrobiaceae bacterium]|nr:hypothetical protein [Hyphomicrobiaceae bacterium]
MDILDYAASQLKKHVFCSEGRVASLLFAGPAAFAGLVGATFGLNAIVDVAQFAGVNVPPGAMQGILNNLIDPALKYLPELWGTGAGIVATGVAVVGIQKLRSSVRGDNSSGGVPKPDQKEKSEIPSTLDLDQDTSMVLRPHLRRALVVELPKTLDQERDILR